jgi:hypothetical protein
MSSSATNYSRELDADRRSDATRENDNMTVEKKSSRYRMAMVI